MLNFELMSRKHDHLLCANVYLCLFVCFCAAFLQGVPNPILFIAHHVLCLFFTRKPETAQNVLDKFYFHIVVHRLYDRCKLDFKVYYLSLQS